MKSEQLKEKWKDPIYRENMRLKHLGQKVWNKGLKTGLIPKTAFKKGHEKTKGWYEAMKKLAIRGGGNFKHGLSGTLEYAKLQNHKRRARKLKNGGYFTVGEWQELKRKSGNKCLACKRFDLKLVADHVIPLARGGSNDINNIQVLCSRCNNKKYTKDTDYRDMIEVSILIPCFNQAEFLADSIESALNQTVPCEIIFINDGSNDNSLEIAKKYPIRIVNQVNKGLASARNTGIMWVTGDFVLPLDADDILLPNCVQRILETIKETDADIIAPSFKCFGKSNETVILNPKIELEMFKNGQNYLPYFCAVKKEKLLEIGGYSPKMVFGWEDLHLWINLLSRGATVKTIPEVLVLYRTKEKSMWTESIKHSEELMAQLHKDFPSVII